MTQIASIGAGMYSDLSVAMLSSTPTFTTLDTFAEFLPYFATQIESVGGTKSTNTFVRIKNVRDFPAMGTPPNIVNVPTYGQSTSQQIQGQSNAPTMEISMNFVATDWAKVTGCLLGLAVGDGLQYVFRFTLLNAVPTGSGVTQYASITTGLGTVPNSQYFWVGKMEALMVKPNLADANTSTLTLTLQSPVYGAYTSDAA